MGGLALLCVLAALSPGTSAAEAAEEGVTRTKQVSRTFEDEGRPVTVDERTVSVTLDHTQDLRGRERVRVSWKGAHPSGGRSASPFGSAGLRQEYPVVILQCRGRDDSALPAARRVSPETCWTSTAQQRFRSTSERQAIWRRDPYARPGDTEQKSGIDPFPTTGCDDVPSFSAHTVPFRAAGGTAHSSCSADTMAPEAAVDAALPAAEQAAFTDTDGTGTASFEVRTVTENQSLGCSDTVPCSIVVIPIMGVSCSEGDAECMRTGRFAPGSSNFAAEGVDEAVSATYWWAGSNWRNRISFPVTFGTAPNVCDVLDSRAPTAFYGSELISQAALQWAPAYCLSRKRFKFQHNRMSDEAAFSLMEKGGAAAALVSGRRESDGDEPVAYAPTAVTGFAVSYVIDRPENAGEYARLRLTPRLLAKLLTQSYTGSAYGAQHPGMANNPQSLNQDPEFQALNPDLDATAREAAATLLSLSDSSDVVRSLTSYIAADREASAFVSGKADRWGMVVNPSYRGIGLPVSEWPLLDTFVPRHDLDCQKQLSTPYFTQLAAPVSSLRTIAEAVLDAWPNVQTKCERASSSDPYKFGRVDRQGVGSRFMLGIVSLGDAERLGLRTAAVRTSASTFVAPTTSSLRAAVATAKPVRGATGAFAMTSRALAAAPAAYPGTMVVYTAARTRGLAKQDARHVAQFIRVSTTEGQRPGSANGTLPDGYLPIVDAGVTKPLFAAARRSADLIEVQRGPTATTPSTKPGASGGGPAGAGGPADAPAADAPAEQTNAAGPVTATLADTGPTAAVTSRAGRLLLPLLLLLGLAAGIAGPALRLLAGARAAR